MGWKTVRSNLKFVLGFKPIAAYIIFGAGAVAGYVLMSWRCS